MGAAVTVFALVSLLFVGAGIACAVAGARIARRTRDFNRRAVRVSGLVVELSYEGRGDPTSASAGGYWVPVLEFTTAEGRPVRTRAMYGSVPAPARPGDHVMVLYDPQQPARALVADRKLAGGGCLSGGMLGVGVGILAMGLLMGAIALVLLRLS
jgi:hypothetical protein